MEITEQPEDVSCLRETYARQAISGSPNSRDLKAKAREGAEAALFKDD